MKWSHMAEVECCGYVFFVRDVKRSKTDKESCINVFCLSKPWAIRIGPVGVFTKEQKKEIAEDMIQAWVESFETDDCDLPSVSWSK